MRSTSKANRVQGRRGRRNYQIESLEEKRLLAADLIGNEVVGGDLVLTFSEAVEAGAGTGNIVIKQHVINEAGVSNDIFVWGANVRSDSVTIDGATVTISPDVDLPPAEEGTNYYVEIDPSTFRDTSTDVASAVILDEDFERLQMFDSPLAVDSYNPDALFDGYALTFTGTLVVNEAGEYTFGGNSDDGMWLAIDGVRTGDQDGVADIFDFTNDEVIFDNTTHGASDRLSTCGSLEPVTACVGSGTDTLTLEEGQYAFEYGYFENGGGSSGEFFYAKGTLEEFDAAAFVLVGDDSQGIGVTEAGITATTYKLDGDQFVDLNEAIDLTQGFGSVAEGFPAEAPVEFADVWNSGGIGRYSANNNLPGTPAVDPPEHTDWSDQTPLGWFQDNEELPLLPGEDGVSGTEDDVPPFPEYAGWNFLDKEWWIAQQGNQDRILFELGQNAVAVVDPDAYDDGDLDIGDGESSSFSAALDSAPISLDGVAENSAVLSFDSSWWNEDWQLADGRVEFFDEAGESLGEDVLFTWDSQSNSANYYPREAGQNGDTVNEHLEFDLNNPAEAASMIVKFGMPIAGNDWWWAIDNVKVTADVVGAAFAGIQDRESLVIPGGTTDDPWPGDANGDDTTDLADFNILKANFNTPGGLTEGDFNNDGVVDLADFNILKENFNTSRGDAAAAAAIFAALGDDDGEDA